MSLHEPDLLPMTKEEESFGARKFALDAVLQESLQYGETSAESECIIRSILLLAREEFVSDTSHAYKIHEEPPKAPKNYRFTSGKTALDIISFRAFGPDQNRKECYEAINAVYFGQLDIGPGRLSANRWIDALWKIQRSLLIRKKVLRGAGKDTYIDFHGTLNPWPKLRNSICDPFGFRAPTYEPKERDRIPTSQRPRPTPSVKSVVTFAKGPSQGSGGARAKDHGRTSSYDRKRQRSSSRSGRDSSGHREGNKHRHASKHRDPSKRRDQSRTREDPNTSPTQKDLNRIRDEELYQTFQAGGRKSRYEQCQVEAEMHKERARQRAQEKAALKEEIVEKSIEIAKAKAKAAEERRASVEGTPEAPPPHFDSPKRKQATAAERLEEEIGKSPEIRIGEDDREESQPEEKTVSEKERRWHSPDERSESSSSEDEKPSDQPIEEEPAARAPNEPEIEEMGLNTDDVRGATRSEVVTPENRAGSPSMPALEESYVVLVPDGEHVVEGPARSPAALEGDHSPEKIGLGRARILEKRVRAMRGDPVSPASSASPSKMVNRSKSPSPNRRKNRKSSARGMRELNPTMYEIRQASADRSVTSWGHEYDNGTAFDWPPLPPIQRRIMAYVERIRYYIRYNRALEESRAPPEETGYYRFLPNMNPNDQQRLEESRLTVTDQFVLALCRALQASFVRYHRSQAEFVAPGVRWVLDTLCNYTEVTSSQVQEYEYDIGGQFEDAEEDRTVVIAGPSVTVPFGTDGRRFDFAADSPNRPKYKTQPSRGGSGVFAPTPPRAGKCLADIFDAPTADMSPMEAWTATETPILPAPMRPTHVRSTTMVCPNLASIASSLTEAAPQMAASMTSSVTPLAPQVDLSRPPPGFQQPTSGMFLKYSLTYTETDIEGGYESDASSFAVIPDNVSVCSRTSSMGRRARIRELDQP